MTIINHDDGTNPLTKMREQTQLATSIAATGCALPDPLLKALILFGLSQTSRTCARNTSTPRIDLAYQ